MQLTRLYPTPSEDQALHGLYLSHRVHTLNTAGSPFVYANFVASVDGRIALGGPSGQPAFVPESLTNRADFRLFQELAAQADCLITHGGYLRALANGQLGNVLQVGMHEDAQDIAAWRKAESLPAQPAVVVASASLDFTLPASLQQHRQDIYIATGKNADPARVEHWQAEGHRVLLAGTDRDVEGAHLISALGQLGFRSIYLVAGPRMLATMLAGEVLDRLYLTTAHQILGGAQFHTLFSGATLDHAAQLELSSLYLDTGSDARTGQSFAQFACKRT